MKAYAILDGGGVLGAALAGALKAAEEKQVEFVGFGGTSAGSIVAALAAVGYTGEELEQVLVETDFSSLLKENGKHVDEFKKQLASIIGGLDKGFYGACGTMVRAACAYLGFGSLKRTLMEQFGVDDGGALKVFLLKKIQAKLPDLAEATDITFANLADREKAPVGSRPCFPLKIVASDVSRRRPVVFSRNDTQHGDSVLEAIRASTCYPFVFKPVDRNRQCWLVDGGLASNLPAFLFHDEQRRTKCPVFAFDLTSDGTSQETGSYNFKRFLKDMISTALDAGDELLRAVLKDVIHVPIRIPDRFDVLDFKINRERRQELFKLGYDQTDKFLEKLEVLNLFKDAEKFVDQLQLYGIDDRREHVIQHQLQARYGDRKIFEAVLYAVAHDIECHTRAENIRAYIMLRTEKTSNDGNPTRIVVYSYGMSDPDPTDPQKTVPHPDSTIEIMEEGGSSGLAWESRRPTCGDLDLARADPSKWKLTPALVGRIPADRKSILSVPIWRSPEAEKDPTSLPVGTLSIDSSTLLGDTAWLEKTNGVALAPDFSLSSEVNQRLLLWEKVIRKLFD